MDRKIISIVLISTIVICLAGCEDQSSIIIDEPDMPSEKPDTPVEKPDIALEEADSVVEANNQLAFDLYSMFKDESDNIFFSPYSISVALAMTYEGAKGKTAEEMQSVLHIPKNAQLRRDSFSEIYHKINSDGKEYKLSTANALWAQENFRFRKDYFDIVEDYYKGSATNLDFIGDTEGSRLVINEWVEEKTNDKIKDLIPSGVLTKDTRLVLTNAIYFKGNWVRQFNENDTKEQYFRITEDNNVKVKMMQRTDDESRFNYAETDNIQVLELPYSGEDLSMLLILPKNDDLKDLESSFSLEKLSEWKEILEEQRVNIYIPKFKFETKYFMKETLTKMGMPTAFSDYADFTGMEDEPNEDLKIDQVIHQAFVELNEEGTEAAAATAVIMARVTSIDSGPVIPTFRADHPFVFIIQEKETGNILFLGRVVDPRK